MTNPLVIGHRGAPERYPENTLPSFEAAIQMGADMIELDIRQSSDNHIVVIHDKDVKGISDQDSLVAEMSLKELQSLDLGNGAFIPTLDEVLQSVKGRTEVDIDIKDFGIEQDILRLVKKHDMLHDVLFSSFFHIILTEMKEFNQDAKIAILYELEIDNPVKYAMDLGAAAINPDFNLLTPDNVIDAHAEGLQVFPWTVNDESQIEEMVKMGVDGIITDHPDICRKLVDGYRN